MEQHIGQIFRDEHQLDQRVGRLENDISALRSDVVHILSALEKVADKVNEPPARTDWGWVAAGVSVLLLFIGALMGPLWSQTASNRNQHEYILNEIAHNKAEIAYVKGRQEGEHGALRTGNRPSP